MTTMIATNSLFSARGLGTVTMAHKMLLGFALSASAFTAFAIDPEELYGTFKLVSSTRTILDTGEVLDTYGKQPTGYMTYGREGRMMVFIVRDDRPKPASIAKMTNQERAALFTSMVAYGGTYKFDGKTVEHRIDISYNELWTGTTQVRDVKKEGNRLIYTTRPAPFSGDGKVGISTLIWEKVK